MFITSGRRKPRAGGVILANVNSEEEVGDIIKQDPFYIYGTADKTTNKITLASILAKVYSFS